MNLKKEKWNKKDYQEYVNYLKSLEDIKYKDFVSKLVNSKYDIRGIKIPMLRKIAKEISKGNYQQFLGLTKDNSFEEVFVEGQIIASIKNEEEFLKLFSLYINKIDNWSLCDSFSNSLVIIKKDLEKYFSYLKNVLKENDEFKIRVVLIIFLSFYIEEKYIDDIINLILNLDNHDYYVDMAVSWLLSEIYLKDKNKVIELFKNKKLTKFVNNKAISKIRDSYRVSKEEKDNLIQWRIK